MELAEEIINSPYRPTKPIVEKGVLVLHVDPYQKELIQKALETAARLLGVSVDNCKTKCIELIMSDFLMLYKQ